MKTLHSLCGLLMLAFLFLTSACDKTKSGDPDSFLVSVSEDNFEAGSKIVYNTSATEFSLTYAPGSGKKSTDSYSGNFWIADTELTYKLWKEIYDWAILNGYELTQYGQPGSDVDYPSTHPVTRVCWYDAVVWCNALTEFFNSHNGDRPDYGYVYTVVGVPVRNHDIDNPEFLSMDVNEQATGFRIPTNAEWYKAADYGGLGDEYASGATGNHDDETATGAVCWYRLNSDMHSHPVAQKLPNSLGLYDMSGNVSEIVFDILVEKYDYKNNIRGGAWNSNPDAVTVSFTHPTQEHTSSSSLGFRIVRTPGDEPAVK